MDTFQFLTFFKMDPVMALVSVLVLLLNHCYVVQSKCDVSIASAIHFRAACKYKSLTQDVPVTGSFLQHCP